MKIKGYIQPKKQEELKPEKGIAESMLGISTLFTELKDLKEDVTNVVDAELEKVDKKVAEFDNTTKEKIEELETKISDFENTAIELIEIIHKIPQIKGEDGKDAEEVDTKAIVNEVLSLIPPPKEINEDKLLKKFIKAIPGNKASLKVIRETMSVDPSDVAKQIMAMEDFTLKTSQVSGLDLLLRNIELKTGSKGYVHGGGFNNIYSASTLVSNGLTGLNFTGSGVNSVTKDNVTGIITVDITGGGGTPGGSDTQLQYNNAGAFGGISGATTNGTTVTYTTGNLVVHDVKASQSAGMDILSNNGTVTALFGAGGGANSTFYGGSKFDYATATTVPYFDASKNLISSAVTPTELGYLSGVTSAIQTQLNGKQSTTISALSIWVANSANTITEVTPGAGNSIRINAGGTAWEAYTPGGGGVPTEITVANESSDTTCFPAFFTAATGDLGPKTNANLTFNSASNILGIGAARIFVPTLDSIAIGSGAGNTSGTGQRNVFIGKNAGAAHSSGTNNVLIGETAGDNIQSGGDNVAVGRSALGACSSGSDNVAIGSSAGLLITGSGNVAIGGSSAGDTISTGSNNVCIGSAADVSTGSIAGSVAIGRVAVATNSNEFITGSSDTPITLMHHIFSTGGADAYIKSAIHKTTSNGAVSNTTTEGTIIGAGTLSTLTLPANYFKAGRNVHIKVWGYMTNTGTPTIRIKFKLGSTVIIDTAAVTMVSITGSMYWVAEGIITCRTTGSSGTVFGQGEFNYYSTSTVKNNIAVANTATSTINTTTTQVVDVTAQWGTANASNVITGTNCIVWIT